MTDREIEQLRENLEDVIFDEDSDGELISANDWKFFEKGTERLEIWDWFDVHHSKGVGFLMYCYKFDRK